MEHCPTRALAKLLEDNDPRTLELLREQMAEHAQDWIRRLELLAKSKNRSVSQAASVLLRELKSLEFEDDFELLCRFFPENGNLEEACWLLAKALGAGDDISDCQELVNEWGHELLLRIAGVSEARKRVEILGEFFRGELGFQGNTADYYNPANSLIPAVVKSRKGLPITLTCLAIFLSHRAGMNVVGVNLPGHFIARHGDIYFDPFHGCRILSMDDCIQILICQGILPTQECFADASALRTLRRILTNLHFVYSRLEENEKLAKVTAWLSALRR